MPQNTLKREPIAKKNYWPIYAARGGEGHMADEQTIYLSPEEELTSVRERLEKTQARKIILVIPPQTQLRSHVGWRLIHARMRELGIELQVICPDRQVRAVARAAGFKVAESQESPSNRPRIGSTRPGAINTRGAGRSRIGSSRAGQPEPTTRRRFTPSAASRPSATGRPDYEEDVTIERSVQGEHEGDKSLASASPTFVETPDSHYEQPRNFQISTTPSVRPSVPRMEDDEIEIDYEEDYNTAQRILRAAREGNSSKGQSMSPASKAEQQSKRTSQWQQDPYAYMEDDQPFVLLPEQKGSAPGPLGSGTLDISDRSTEIMSSEIEDLGDMGSIALPEPRAGRTFDEPAVRPPRTRSGQMPPAPRRSPRAPRPGMQDFDEEEERLALPERRVPPASRPPGSSRELAGWSPASSRGASSELQPRRVPSQAMQSAPIFQDPPKTRSAPISQRPVNRQIMPPSAPSRRPPVAAPRRQPRNNRGLLTVVALAVLFIFILGGLFYFVPSAKITISLPAKSFSQQVQLNATTDAQSSQANTVAAHVLTQTFSASRQGTASGTTRVGNKQAQGIVTFTNSSNIDIVVPTNTVLATSTGIQFLTLGQQLVSQNSDFPAAPVIAEVAGESGNVKANTITIIPQSSITSIAQYNHVSASSINLTVNNSRATTGGGATNVLSVTKQDRDALTLDLHKTLQQQIQSWLTAQIHNGDIQGTLTPNVLASPTPLSEEQLTGAPAAGQPDPAGTFNGTMSISVKILVVRSADLQAAAGTQLNTAAGKLKPTATLARALPVTFTHIKSTATQNGNALTISALASGEIVPQLNQQDISSKLASKGVNEAVSELQSGALTNQVAVKNVQITISPSFLTILPLRAQQIQIILQPVQATP
jgi:hypothetical protein